MRDQTLILGTSQILPPDFGQETQFILLLARRAVARTRVYKVNKVRLCGGFGVTAFVFFLCGLKVTPGELATGSALQVFLECSYFSFGPKCDHCFDPPSAMFHRMCRRSSVMLR
jgi:hypothetical protein